MNAKRPASAAGQSWRKWERQPWDEANIVVEDCRFVGLQPRVRWWEPVLVWLALFAMFVVAVLGGVSVG